MTCMFLASAKIRLCQRQEGVFRKKRTIHSTNYLVPFSRAHRSVTEEKLSSEKMGYQPLSTLTWCLSCTKNGIPS